MNSTLDTPSSTNSAVAMNPILAVHNLGFTFPGGHGNSSPAPVFSEIYCEVPRGSVTALLGKNGSGKSTLLRCCAGLLKPTAGTVSIHGTRAKTTTGFIFQKHLLVPRLSALSNVIHGAFSYSGGPQLWCQSFAPRQLREKALHCLEQVGLAAMAPRAVTALSGGQAQRVAVARALMQDPELLFADEPAASLDPRAGAELMELFVQLTQSRSLSVLVATHHLDHVTAFTTNTIALHRGAIVYSGATSALPAQLLEELYR